MKKKNIGFLIMIQIIKKKDITELKEEAAEFLIHIGK